MADRIAVISPDGQFGTVDATDAEAVSRAGGKVLTRAEVKAREQEEAYQAQSTGAKVAGWASAALPFTAQNALSATGIAPIRSEVEAFNSGASSAATLGLDEVAVKHGLDAVQPGAGKAYGKHILDAREVHGGFHTAGQVVGFAAMAAGGGGLSGAAKALPGAGVSALGGVAEQGVARVLGGLAARGVAGRAASTAAELGARGAVEGALYSGADAINEADLGDHDVVADKVFAAMGTGALYGGAGGAVLGGAGSLGAAGARAGGRAVVGGVSRVLGKGSEAAAGLASKAESVAADAGALGARAADAADDAVSGAKGMASRTAVEATEEAGKAARFAAEQTGTKVGQEVGSIRGSLAKMGEQATQKGWANEQAWKAIGAGNGLQSTGFAKSAERYLPNGVKDVGEVILRKGILNVEDGVFAAGRNGTPAAMLPKIEAELAITGQKIGDMTAASPARVPGVEIGDAVSRVASKYEASAATRPVGKTLRAFGESLRESLGITQLDSSVAVQDLIRERKALDKMVFENAALDASMTIEVKRELRAELEGLVVKSMDEASGKLPGEQRAAYKALKHDYTALSIASDAAEDSAARMAKGATFGLTDTLRGGGSIIKTIGSKLVRERGNAAAAVLLSRMADMGTITKALAAIDEHIGKASAGVLAAPKKLPLPEGGSLPVQASAAAAMEKWAKVSADPDALATRAAGAGEHFQGTAPMLAGGLSQRLTSAAAFMIGKMPTVPDPDPFDPHPRPLMTDAQASEYALYDYYAEKPTRFFEEAAHGKLTYEGVEVARALMPGAFAEMQQRTIEGLADLMAKKRPPPYLARQRLGMMLDFPAVPEQRPDHMAFLQRNVIGSEKAGQANVNTLGAQSPPKRPMPTKSQSSTLDRLEGK